ncbi:MAG: hypothetical protein ACOX05_04715 [Bacillota bacterium]|jgi:hypothetical protein
MNKDSRRHNGEANPVEKSEERLKLEADRRQEEAHQEDDGGRYRRRKYRMIIMMVLLVLVIVLAFSNRDETFLTDSHKSFTKQGFNIEIINHSDDILWDWQLIYDDKKQVKIPALSPNKSFTTNVSTKQTEGENVMCLRWQDDAGLPQEQVILGFYKQGFNGSVTVTVTKVADGQFMLEPRSSYY